MGTSSSTLEVGKALRSLLTDAPVDEGLIALLLSTALSNTEVERALPFSTLRLVRHYYTKNFALLLFKCIEAISQARSASLEPVADLQAVSRRLLTALCLLRRLLPIAMESGDTPCDEEEPVAAETPNANDAVTDVGPRRTEAGGKRRRTRFTASFVRSFFEENLACDEEQPTQLLLFLPGQNATLGKFLGRLLVDCCFIRGLTLPTAFAPAKPCESHPSVEESLLWYPGVGGMREQNTAPQVVGATTHAVRKELLYTLTVALALPLFSPPATRDTVFSEPLLNVDETPFLPTLVASTLNAILSYVPFGSMPYTSHWIGNEEDVVLMSARFLCAMICYPGAAVDDPAQATNMTGPAEQEHRAAVTAAETQGDAQEPPVLQPPSPQPKKIIHSARELICTLTPEEAKYVVVRLKNIIGLKLYSNRTFLPESQHCFLTQDDFMMLLWRLVELSPQCRVAFGQQPEAMEYIVPLVDYALDARRDPKYFPHLQLVLFILLRLSELRTFCLQCNAAFRERLPFEFESFVGSYNDLLIIMLCSFMLFRHEMICPLHVTCSSIISNLASFISDISPVTAERLSLVFTSVATRCLAYEASAASNAVLADNSEVTADQVVMLGVVGAVASVLQYHERAAATLLAAFVKRKSLVKEVSEVFLAEGCNKFRVQLTSPFLIDTIRDAIAAVEEAVAAAEAAGVVDTAAVIRNTSLVGALPTPHRIVVRRLYSTESMEQWAMATAWSSLYMYAPPGTFGERKSVKMLRFV
ncbi:putative protein HID1 isoform 1 [Trypanosoma conorhini]|uniref:Dymeclin n=1 Tax=Trypanosoma conorhini TaxID=83891 RepID=A0A3R7L4P9_9TRYP|nr:putative protein HID1 isoform 1 [Trypanosoma conorhini]RNF07569.1 putative protein HID1 isoform 1 [Trypanosoma conorhini]